MAPFEPGTTGNPGGRPKGLARLVREKCGGDDGAKMIEIMWGIATDEHAPRRDRMAAIQWCADRGWGKAVDIVVIEETPTGRYPMLDLDRLTADQLRLLRDLYAAARPDGHPIIEATSGGS